MSAVATENTILVSEKAKAKILQLMQEAEIVDKPEYFLRVGVVGGGCSGLSYKLDFDNGSGTFTSFSGSYSETQTGLRIKGRERSKKPEKPEKIKDNF